jgi:hypothetical protein
MALVVDVAVHRLRKGLCLYYELSEAFFSSTPLHNFRDGIPMESIHLSTHQAATTQNQASFNAINISLLWLWLCYLALCKLAHDLPYSVQTRTLL